ncbi:MAG: KilA-N domain-containing protein [Bacteroidia bacterium]|nr:KilA-N domain-containing protein [Bacteroidia bacterium]
MAKEKKSTIHVQGLAVSIISQQQDDYISITDIARHRDAERSDYILQNWLRNRSTIEFIGLWEQLRNPNFNSIEFDGIKNMAGSNSFSLTPKRWIETTNAIGIVSKTGRYGGTYAHKDIAFEFASWISAEFKLYLIVEFQRLKEDENRRLSLEWNLNRTLSKVNYRIHTDAIKENIIPANITKEQEQFIYANEADVLNVALFGNTAQKWRKANPDKEGNVRDYSTVEQLLVLANLESMNAEFIRMGLPQGERLRKLNTIAIQQLKSLVGNINLKKLDDGK